MPPSTIRTRFWPFLRVLAASTALVASSAQAQYGAVSRPRIGLPPSVELNLDVLSKLKTPPAPQLRKVPSEQPYVPPVALPAIGGPQSVTSAVAPANLPFARGESGANVLSDVSSKNYTPPPKPVVRPTPRPVVKAPAAVPAAAPVVPKPVPTPPAAVAAPAPVIPKPVVPPPVAAPTPSKTKPVDTSPMMVPVPRTAPAPITPREVPAQAVPPVGVVPPAPAPIAPTGVAPLPDPAPLAPVVKPVAPVNVPPPAPASVTPPPVTSVPKPITPPQAVKPAPVAPAPSAAIPPLAPVVTPPAKTTLGVPAAPSLDGLDFSGMKADDDGLGDLTPQKLLGKPVETMVVAKPSTLPEIEVPSSSKTQTPPRMDALPVVTAEKKPAPMLPSISNRVEKLFTKDDPALGVTNDTTRVINPVAEKKAAEEKAAKTAEKPKPAELPKSDLPPLLIPQEKSVKIADNAPAIKVTNEKAKPKPALDGLPSLDAITGDKEVPSSMDVVEPKDGITARETLPPPTLPKPAVVPAPKVTPEVKKPEVKPAEKPVVKEAPKAPPPLSPLAITPKVKPDISEDTKIASLPPLPDMGMGKKGDPALAPAMPQLPPPSASVKKPEPKPAKAPEPIKVVEPVKPAVVPEIKASAPAAPEPLKPKPSGKAKEKASIGFTKDAAELSAEAKSELMDMAEGIKSKDASVRIVAYAKGTEDEASLARRVSMSRALAVRAFLISKGVNQLKINVQALGHNAPSGGGDPDRADVMVY